MQVESMRRYRVASNTKQLFCREKNIPFTYKETSVKRKKIGGIYIFLSLEIFNRKALLYISRN